MSTKNLSRSVIEGGRSRWCSTMRRFETASDRRSERSESHRLLTAVEIDAAMYRPRHKRYRDFRDKLGPAGRFLSSRVGRRWDHVRSELFARFDARTTAGRHILFDHVLKSINGGYGLGARYRFFVDSHGILRDENRRRRLGAKK